MKELSCTKCGATFSIINEGQKQTCTYCGATFLVDELKQNQTIQQIKEPIIEDKQVIAKKIKTKKMTELKKATINWWIYNVVWMTAFAVLIVGTIIMAKGFWDKHDVNSRDKGIWTIVIAIGIFLAMLFTYRILGKKLKYKYKIAKNQEIEDFEQKIKEK